MLVRQGDARHPVVECRPRHGFIVVPNVLYAGPLWAAMLVNLGPFVGTSQL